jgi:hypothetical protein
MVADVGTRPAFRCAYKVSVIEITSTEKSVKDLSMVTRKLSTAALLTAGLSVSLLAQHATATEANPAFKQPVLVEVTVSGQQFRADIESYVRALNKEIRDTLDQELKRSLTPKIELASNELRARG